jgi:membrane fusion protein (multidrug efflux system)
MNKLLFGLGLLSIVCFCSCTQKAPPPTPPVPVNLISVAAQPVLYYDKYPATTEALSQVNLYPEVQGYITGIFFKDGDEVKKGQKLYEIDTRLYKASVDAAEANLKVAKGNYTQAKQDADRYEYLNSYNAVAKQLYDHAIITLQNAKNQVEAAEEAVKTAKTNLTYAVIDAPFDGTVGFSQVKMGNMVTVGQTVLNTISTNNPMAVDFLVNEKQLQKFEGFQNNTQGNNDSLFTMVLPDGTTYPFTGKISVIDRAVDPQTGSIRVRLVFPNPKNELKAGMSCVVRVRNLETTPQILIPNKAIVEQMGEYFVFIAKDTVYEHPSSDTAKKVDTVETPKLRSVQRKVQLGQTIGPNVIVLSGINVGDKLLVDGVQAVHDGSQIAAGNKKPAGEGEKSKKPEAKKEN